MDASLKTLISAETHHQGRNVVVGIMQPPQAEIVAAPVQVALGESTEQQSAQQTDSQPPYLPQFSTATSLILSRVNAGPGGLESALSSLTGSAPRPDASMVDETRKKLRLSFDVSSTMPLRIPAGSSPSSPFKHRTSQLNGASGAKRKRDPNSADVDFTKNTISFPSPPVIPQAAPSMSISLPQRDRPAEIPGITSERRRQMERMREKRLSQLPSGVVPAKPELVGFGPGGSSDRARTEYFLGKKRTDLLNILSFCDQLEPQLLTDILVSVSKRHPNLPIFDSPDWEARTPGFKRSSHASAVRSAHPEAKSRQAQNAAQLKARQRAKALKKSLKPSRPIEVREVLVKEEEEDEDALPPTWPQAGEGLYAKLMAETEDRKYLIDHNDEEAFSQFMVDKNGKQIVEPI